MRDDPGEDPARPAAPPPPPPPPPRSLPGVTAPLGGDRANSSYAEDRRLSPGVWEVELRLLSSCGRRTSSCRLEGRTSVSRASSSSIGCGENRDFSPKWAAGTEEEIGVMRGLVRCWGSLDVGGVVGGLGCSNGINGDEEDCGREWRGEVGILRD